MKTTHSIRYGAWFLMWLATGCLLAGGIGTAAAANSKKSINIGVMTPQALHNGPSYINGAKLAAKQINTAGGINGRPVKIFIYDTKESATSAVRAFQRAVDQNHVIAMTGTLISEVALALEPLATRLKTPFIISGSASPKIAKRVHDHYDKYKYTFQQFMNSYQMARGTCGMARDVLVGDLHYKTAVLFSEDAAWTKPLDEYYDKCLPKAGLKIVDHIKFSVHTNDFTPLFNRIESDNPDVIINAISHVGTKPVTQWHSQHVPALMAGPNGQGSSAGFWAATNGDTEGVIVGGTISANGAALTPKTPKFYKQYVKTYGKVPAFSGYTTYDAIYTLKDAIERAGGTKPGKLVKALEHTDRTGVSGQIEFQGRDDSYTHGLVYKKHQTGGVYFQWQHDKQVVIWPESIAQGQVIFPSFVPNPNGGKTSTGQ